MRINKKIAGGVVAGAVLVAGGGAAWAYWSSSGVGSGSATTGSSVSFQVSSTAATGGTLSPNGATDSVAFTVKNPGPGAQQLNKVDIKIANSDGSAWTPTGCSAADFSLNGAAAGSPVTDTSVAGDLAANGTASSHVTIQMVDTSKNQDGCQNVTVPLYFAAS